MKLFGEIPVIDDVRMLIRRPDDGDAAQADIMRHEAEVYRYLPGFLYELQYSDKIGDARSDTRYKVEVLGIFLKEDDQMAGLLELFDYDREAGTVSIGYRLRSEYWGRGIASEAVQLVLAYLRERTAVSLVSAHVMIANRASCRVLEKCGFSSDYVCFTEDWGRGAPVEVYAFSKILK